MGRKGGHQLLKRSHTGPAHGYVYEGREPFGTVYPEGIDEHPYYGYGPDYGKQCKTSPVSEDYDAYRSIASGYQDKYHHVVNLAKELVDLRGDIEGVVNGTRSVEQYHAGNKDAHGQHMSIAGSPRRFYNQGYGGSEGKEHGYEMSNGASRVLYPA